MLLVTLAAAAVTAQKPPDLLLLVAASFSIAAATFFPALVLGVFWARANFWGASLGMLAGFGVTVYYMATSDPWLHGLLGLQAPIRLWGDSQPIPAAVFGVPAGLAVIVVVSLLTRAPGARQLQLVQTIRYPGKG